MQRMNKKVGWIILLLIIAIFNCSVEKKKEEKQKEIFPLLKGIISISSLEKAGMEHFDPLYMEILVENDYIYILNTQDSLIMKFLNSKPLRAYKEKSQGPGGMLFACSIFSYNSKTITVIDLDKSCVLMFDHDLNYQSESRLLTPVRKIKNTRDLLLGFEIFPDNKLFCTLDRKFNITGKYVDAILTAPFKLISPPKFNNMGYLLNDGTVALTSWQYLEKRCSIKIFDIHKEGKTIMLQWDQDHTPSQKDIDQRSNYYSSVYVGKHWKYYIVFNNYTKSLNNFGYNELLIFSEEGTLIFRKKLDITIINTMSAPGDPRIFFFDDEKGILVLNLKEY